MSWECEHCDEDHESPEDCCFCGGEGSDEGQYCSCPAGEALWKAAQAEFAWMEPLAKRAVQAERDGDHESADALKQEAMIRRG